MIFYKIFHLSKTLEKCFEKFFIPVPIMERKGTLPADVFKMLLPGQMIPSFSHHKIMFDTVNITDDDVRFYDGPRMLMHKTAKAVY